MIDEKKELLERRGAKKLKEQMKKGEINLNSLQREIHGDQFHFTTQPVWSQSFSAVREHNHLYIKNKDQRHESLDVQG